MNTLVLDKTQIEQKINRIAYQIFEDNFEEKEIYVAGIAPSGFVLAQKIVHAIENISSLKVHLLKINMDKENPLSKEIQLPVSFDELKNKIIILVDDVLNSGKTLIYGMRPFLDIDIKKIRTVVLVDRNHKRFPIAADYVGISLATTMQEHITVEFGKKESVYLS